MIVSQIFCFVKWLNVMYYKFNFHYLFLNFFFPKKWFVTILRCELCYRGMGTSHRRLYSIHGLESSENIRKIAEETWKYIYVSNLQIINLFQKSSENILTILLMFLCSKLECSFVKIRQYKGLSNLISFLVFTYTYIFLYEWRMVYCRLSIYFKNFQKPLTRLII